MTSITLNASRKSINNSWKSNTYQFYSYYVLKARKSTSLLPFRNNNNKDRMREKDTIPITEGISNVFQEEEEKASILFAKRYKSSIFPPFRNKRMCGSVSKKNKNKQFFRTRTEG
ncbi:hypothetical protein CDAR_482461 [Caerostris darwini]|uniref:Ribosomal protein S18 n=1 Tax=Caerostris darwini TaxID=1538125 RepID=A0AAV4WNT4_9ARAC|nr:hypothetical protein CDAR_482461 [Caerostris darwini]